jgi:hydroxymethylpyrimidine/phosphomethylpyrimidine kinase
MRAPLAVPCALSIAGLDPSGGAGIAADLRAFAAAEVWGCAACAALTVQSTAGLRSVLPTPPEQLRAQVDEVLAHQRVTAIKTGALGSTANVLVAVDTARKHPHLPLVVDPVMIATRAHGGARLLDDDALAAMRELVALATVVTPNVDEAEALLACRIADQRDQAQAALALVALGARAALVKGGHLDGDLAVDVLAFQGRTVALASPRLASPPFHGGGCHLASLIAGHLARARPGCPPDERAIEAAARLAKGQIDAAVAAALDVGGGLLVLPVSRR